MQKFDVAKKMKITRSGAAAYVFNFFGNLRSTIQAMRIATIAQRSWANLLMTLRYTTRIRFPTNVQRIDAWPPLLPESLNGTDQVTRSGEEN